MFGDLRTGMVHWAQQLSVRTSIQRRRRRRLSLSADTKHGTRHTRHKLRSLFYIFKKLRALREFWQKITFLLQRHFVIWTNSNKKNISVELSAMCV